jgi:hypothetical protein
MRGCPVAALAVRQRVVFVPVGVVVEISILADIERAVRAGQERREIAFDVARRRRDISDPSTRMRPAVLPEYCAWNDMIFSKCTLVRSRLRILVRAATDRIDQRDGASVFAARLIAVASPASARDRQIHAVGVDVFLVLAPAAEFSRRIRRHSSSTRRVSLSRSGGRRLDLEGFADRRSRRGIVDDRLSSACIRSGSSI